MAVSTVVLKLLFILGFRDPGIAKRIREKPSSTLGSLQQWVWNDQGKKHTHTLKLKKKTFSYWI